MYAFRADLMKIRLQVLTSKVAFPLDQQYLPLGFYPVHYQTLAVVVPTLTNVTNVSSELIDAQDLPPRKALLHTLLEQLVVILHRLVTRLLVFHVR